MKTGFHFLLIRSFLFMSLLVPLAAIHAAVAPVIPPKALRVVQIIP